MAHFSPEGGWAISINQVNKQGNFGIWSLKFNNNNNVSFSPFKQANGYKYEVIGGQHNLMACQKMNDKYPDKDRQMATNMKSSVDSII